MKSLPGWTIKIDEISSGAYRVKLTDSYGHIAELVGDGSGESIERAIGYAFDLEKQISKRWSLFLYEFCLSMLADVAIKEKKYHEQAFGSWYISFFDKNIVYDGRDFWLYLQAEQNNNWIDKKIIKREDLAYSNFKELVNAALLG